MMRTDFCSGKHAHGMKHAWLCITNDQQPNVHHHVCGTHAKPYRKFAGPFVFRTIDPNHETQYAWINGKGCARMATRTDAERRE